MKPLYVAGASFWAVAPEVILAVGGMIVLLSASFLRPQARSVPTILSVLFLIAGGLAAVLAIASDAYPSAAFDGTIALDGFATFLKVTVALGALVTVLASQHYLDAEGGSPGEYLGLVLFAASGMMLMSSASDLIVIFIALETFSLAFYVLAAYRKRRLDSQEGALKYFLTGSFSSAFFLYGTALVFGFAGTTRLAGVANAVQGSSAPRGLLVAGLGLLIVGLGFKVGAVPFHMWAPDVYQGSPAPASGFMAAGAKVAGFAAMLRILMTAFDSAVSDWRPILTGLAVLTMLLGSIVAVAQTNVKRMLAYSSIAHSGFLLTGVAAANSRGISGSLFYLLAYTFSIIGAFAVVYAIGRPGEHRVTLDDYRGLGAREPFLAGAFALFLISLAGIPPTAGFWAKFEVFSAAVSAGQTPLVVLGVLASAVAAFFYLRVIVLMFLEESPEWDGTPAPSAAFSMGLAILVAGAVVVIVGVLPGLLLKLAADSLLLFR